mgnify:CR=1 FL=1
MMVTLGIAGLCSGLAIVGIFLVTQPMIERNRAEALEALGDVTAPKAFGAAEAALRKAEQLTSTGRQDREALAATPWRHVVLDEAHTYDGAQGADVAVLAVDVVGTVLAPDRIAAVAARPMIRAHSSGGSPAAMPSAQSRNSAEVRNSSARDPRSGTPNSQTAMVTDRTVGIATGIAATVNTRAN